MGTSLLRTNHLIMKLLIASQLFVLVAASGHFTDKEFNSTEDRYIQYDFETEPRVKLTLYNREIREGFQIYPIDTSKVYPQEIVTLLSLPIPLKVFVHGFLSSGEKYEKKRKMATNFLDTEDVNVILVTWRSKGIPYKKAAIRSMDVGEFLAKWLFKYVYRSNPTLDLHLIGHSLGAQAVGNTGRLLKKNGYPPRRVTGLDPAGPRFEWPVAPRFEWPTPGLRMIGKESGLFVDIIHTNPGILGVKKQYGHVDFYVDGGYQNLAQFRGTRDGWGKVRNYFSHSHATTMFIETIKEPTKYWSSLCGSVDDSVKTLYKPICTYRQDGYNYGNYLGYGAVKINIDQAYGTYIPKLTQTEIETELQTLEDLDMDDGMETDDGRD